jgi:hypothetical protein
MSAYSEKIAKLKSGIYRVSDFEVGKPVTHVIAFLAQDVQRYDESMDILHFSDTGMQLRMNVTNSEVLIRLLGDDPEKWTGHSITLFLHEYAPTKSGIRIRAAGPDSGNSARAIVHAPEPPPYDDPPF